MLREFTVSSLGKRVVISPLSQEEGGGGVVAIPLSDFPSYHFCVFAKIAIRSIYPPFIQIPMYLWKKISNILPWKKLWGGWGGGGFRGREGKGWQQKWINFRSFHFLISSFSHFFIFLFFHFLIFSFSYFSFCHNNDYVPEILET